MKTIFGLFDNYAEANAAVHDLLASGFHPDELNAVLLETTAKNSMDVNLNQIKTEKSEELGEPTAYGLDGLLGGEKALNVTDTGRVYAAGELANLLANTASQPGAADGGLKAALIDFSLPSEAAESYRDGVKAGGVLFFIRTSDERASEAAEILRTHEAGRVANTIREGSSSAS